MVYAKKHCLDAINGDQIQLLPVLQDECSFHQDTGRNGSMDDFGWCRR